MDPLTAALQLANTIAKIALAQLETATPEQRRELLQMFIDDAKRWRGLIDRAVGALGA